MRKKANVKTFSKKSMYDSIMMDVAKIVKKRVDESVNDDYYNPHDSMTILDERIGKLKRLLDESGDELMIINVGSVLARLNWAVEDNDMNWFADVLDDPALLTDDTDYDE